MCIRDRLRPDCGPRRETVSHAFAASHNATTWLGVRARGVGVGRRTDFVEKNGFLSMSPSRRASSNIRLSRFRAERALLLLPVDLRDCTNCSASTMSKDLMTRRPMLGMTHRRRTDSYPTRVCRLVVPSSSRFERKKAQSSAIVIVGVAVWFALCMRCLLYTSDAADDLTRVDLGGR